MEITTKKDVFTDNTQENEVRGKVIRKGRLARMILREGGEDVRIIDVKQAKENPERSVFVFKNDDKFQRVFERVLDENKKLRSEDNDSKIKDLEQQIADLKKLLEKKGE